jgi:hypothetical protein
LKGDWVGAAANDRLESIGQSVFDGPFNKEVAQLLLHVVLVHCQQTGQDSCILRIVLLFELIDGFCIRFFRIDHRQHIFKEKVKLASHRQSHQFTAVDEHLSIVEVVP